VDSLRDFVVSAIVFITFAFAIHLTGIQPKVGFLQIGAIQVPQRFSIIGVGKQFGINLSAMNPIGVRIFNAFGFSQAYVEDVDADTDQKVNAAFEKEPAPVRTQYYSGVRHGPELGQTGTIWTTITTPPLTQHQFDGFRNGTVRIYFVSWVAWSTSRDRNTKDFTNDCRWLQPMVHAAYKQEDLVWHFCQ
jgi:hypothetical protein